MEITFHREMQCLFIQGILVEGNILLRCFSGDTIIKPKVNKIIAKTVKNGFNMFISFRSYSNLNIKVIYFNFFLFSGSIK